MKKLIVMSSFGLLCLAFATENNTSICVEIDERVLNISQKQKPKDNSQPKILGYNQPESVRKLEQIKEHRHSLSYLKRLMEHFISHEKGYVSVAEGCQETIKVELYPLSQGWTAFARYSKNGREERVDRLYPEEYTEFSERVVIALLKDVHISKTINRNNVLKNDSRESVQQIKGKNQYLFGGAMDIRIGNFNSVSSGKVKEELRWYHPLVVFGGYRGRYENWGLEALVRFGAGTGNTATGIENQEGHIDYQIDAGMSLHFLKYRNPRGLSSFYYGGGSTLGLYNFSVIKPKNYDDKSYLTSGGLDLDGVLGWEFMRANFIQFFLQFDVKIPAYKINTQNKWGKIDTWMPGVGYKVGILF